MPTPFKLGDVSRGDVLGSGLYLGNKIDATLWADGENIVFYNGGVQKKPGKELLFDNVDIVTGLSQARIDEYRRVYTGSATNLKFFENYLVTTIGAGYSNGDWSLETWGKWLVATNNFDPPVIWKNTGMAFDLTVPFTRCKLLTKNGPFLLAANTSNGQNWIEWAKEGNPEDWSLVLPTSAGNLPVQEFNSEIMSEAKLSSANLFASQESIAILQYIGGVGIFGYRHIPAGGAVSKSALVSRGSLVYGMSRQAIWITDGSSVQNIDRDIRVWLQDHVNWGAAINIRSYHDEILSTIVWLVPIDGAESPNAAIGFNYENSTWTKFIENVGAADEKSVFDYPLVGMDNLVVLGSNGDDTTSAWSLTTKPLNMGYEQNWKWLDQLINTHHGDIYVEFGFAEHGNDDAVIEWTAKTLLNIQHDILRESVYTTVRFSGTGDFRLNEMQIYGQIGAYTL